MFQDCVLDLVSCVVDPIARAPQDPLVLAAIGTAVFTGALAAPLALSATHNALGDTTVDTRVASFLGWEKEEDKQPEYFPILLEGGV